MKKQKLIYILLLFCTLNSFGQTKSNGPILSFEQIKIVDTVYYNYGNENILDVPSKQYYFFFSNIGQEPLILENAPGGDPAFNCQYPKEPIAPGGKGCLTICFPVWRACFMERIFSIVSNADTVLRLRIVRIPKLVQKADTIDASRFSFKQSKCDCSKLIKQGVYIKPKQFEVPKNEEPVVKKIDSTSKQIQNPNNDYLIELKPQNSIDTAVENRDTVYREEKRYADSTVRITYLNGRVIQEFTTYNVKHKKEKKQNIPKTNLLNLKTIVLQE